MDTPTEYTETELHGYFGEYGTNNDIWRLHGLYQVNDDNPDGWLFVVINVTLDDDTPGMSIICVKSNDLFNNLRKDK